MTSGSEGASTPVDAVITSLIGAAPLGVGGILLVLFGLLLRREAQDRSDYRTQIAELAKRHAAELARITTAHDAELAELREEIKGLRQQVDDLNQKLDAERDRRRAAEDSAMGQLGRHQQGNPPWPN
jgi:septal ring factor EnvC (AmiA/AmiB activator)